MAQAIDHLAALVRGCLVQVNRADSAAESGSGFFIAPGTVLTCAHVAGAAGSPVTVHWRDRGGDVMHEVERDDKGIVERDDKGIVERAVEGVVRWASPLETSEWLAPYPDLAIVALARVPGAHPLVWLDDHLPSLSANLVVTGYGEVPGQGLGPSSGWYTHGGGQDRMIRLIGDEVTPGMSGAPVLNAQTGGVCAVTKATRQQGTPWGGYAVPIRGIRTILNHREYRRLRGAHDDHHRRNRHWIDLADGLRESPGDPLKSRALSTEPSDSGVGRRSERELLAILADLPEAEDPNEHRNAYLRVAGPLAGELRHPLHDRVDVVTELADLVPPLHGFPHVLGYAVDLARATAGTAVGERLRLWIGAAASPLGLSEQAEHRLTDEGQPVAPQDATPSIMVSIRPAGHDRTRYRCMIWRCTGGSEIVPIGEDGQVTGDGRAEPLETIRQRLQARLPDLVRATAGGRHRAMIELIVPPELMDEGVDHWLARPGRSPWSTLGRTHPVVVRELERFDEDDTVLWSWRERWNALHDRDVGATLHGVSCQDRRDHESVQGWLELDVTRAALVLPCSPNHPPALVALEVGLEAGVPVMIWRRDGCTGDPGVSHDDCAGQRLMTTVQAELRGAYRHDVPERVRALRNAAATLKEEDPEHCGREIVVLWDDPERRPPRRPMVPPSESWRHG